jgi:hypothetical protein
MSKLIGAERVEAEGVLSTFTLSIDNPPPDDMLDTHAELEGRPLGLGLVVVGNPDTDYTVMTTWHGLVLDHMVLYVPAQPPAGSVLTAFLHGSPPTAGFHLYDVRKLTEAERQERLTCVNAMPHQGMELDWVRIYTECGGAGNDELYPAAADLDTELHAKVVDDASIVELINSIPHPLGI